MKMIISSVNAKKISKRINNFCKAIPVQPITIELKEISGSQKIHITAHNSELELDIDNSIIK